jgi:hypothetical protein
MFDQESPYERGIGKSMNPFETFVPALDALREQYLRLGLLILETLQEADPEMATLLPYIYDTREPAAEWLVDDVPVFGGRSAVELLARGEREAVLDSLRAQIAGCA